jgi:hypothetical protein
MTGGSKKPNCILLTVLLVCALTSHVLGCATAPAVEAITQPLPVAAESNPAFATLPSLATLRALSFVPADLVQPGSAYIAGMSGGVTAGAGDATFTPDFDQASPGPASQPAWAVYVFTLSSYTNAAAVIPTFTQSGAPADLWLAVSDWADNRWRLIRPGASGQAGFTASAFAELLEPGTDRFAVAVITLGQQPWTLDEVRIDDAAVVFPNADCPLGVNLEGLSDYMTSMPFVDAFKTAREWFSQPSDGSVWDDGRPIPLDANGWPTSLLADQYAATVLMTDQAGNYPVADYVCLYDGEGTLHFGIDASIVNEQPGRIEVHVTPQAGGVTHLQIQATNPANPIRNIRFILPGYEGNYQTQVFTPEFLASCQPFKVLRFMDWMATNHTTVTTPATLSQIGYYTQTTSRGAAVELMVDLCNRLQADPWFCMGHLMDDAAVAQFATYVRDNLDPSLRIYIEHSNEVWNGIFPQAAYAQAQGLALNLDSDPFVAQLDYHSRRSVQVFAVWESVYGGTDRLVRVLGSQAANPFVADTIANFENAYQQADAVAIAPYFGFMVEPAEADAVKAGGLAGILARWPQEIANNAVSIDENKALCDGLGLDLIGYEGGQHLVGIFGAENDDALTALMITANRDPALRQLYLDYLNDWRARSGQHLMMAFSHMGSYSKFGSWGLRETQAQDPATAPKWMGCMDFLGQF